jgi:hypothetical protein
MQGLHQCFQRIKKEGIFCSSPNEVSRILILKPDMTITRQENYIPITLMNTDMIFLNEFSANYIQVYTKMRIYQHIF